jgi:hypothetical protein
MNIALSQSHLWHIAAGTSLCIAALSFLAMVVLMIVTENARRSRAIACLTVRSRFKIVFTLAAATGLLTAAPFAWVSGAHSPASFLVYEVVYTGVTAFGALVVAVLVTRVATGEIEISDYEPYETSIFERSSLHGINPASGLPMNGSLDIAGNPYGCDSHSTIRHMFIE